MIWYAMIWYDILRHSIARQAAAVVRRTRRTANDKDWVKIILRN